VRLVLALLLSPGVALLGCRGSEPPGSPQVDELIEVARPETQDPEPQVSEPEFHWQRQYRSDESAGVFAVVPPRATLHRTSRLDGPGWTYDGWDNAVVRVLGVEGEAVEIELDWELSDRAVHCVYGSVSRNKFGLRVFVHRDQLEEVTSEGQSISLGVDEGINVAPGVLVGRVFDIVEPGLLKIGKFYTPASFDSLPVPLAEQAAGSLSYGSGADTPSGKHDLCFTSWDQLYERSASDPPRALIGGPCLQIAGSVRFNPPGTSCGGSKGGGGMTCHYKTRDAWTVAAGTELTWQKGGPAGRTYQDVLVNERPRVRGDVACFNPELTCGAIELFRVCVPASSVAYTPLESLDLGGLLSPLPPTE
jgi:hypothetical protein